MSKTACCVKKEEEPNGIHAGHPLQSQIGETTISLSKFCPHGISSDHCRLLLSLYELKFAFDHCQGLAALNLRHTQHSILVESKLVRFPGRTSHKDSIRQKQPLNLLVYPMSNPNVWI